MDAHPILVHFPIALLTLYALFELIRFKFVIEKPYWFFVKAILVIIGFLGALAAAATGPHWGERSLLHMHETFAKITIFIFLIIASGYAYAWYKPFNRYSAFLHKSYNSVILAFLGLTAVVITGSLGGALVYGTHFDPLMAPVFKLLGVY